LLTGAAEGLIGDMMWAPNSPFTTVGPASNTAANHAGAGGVILQVQHDASLAGTVDRPVDHRRHHHHRSNTFSQFANANNEAGIKHLDVVAMYGTFGVQSNIVLEAGVYSGPPCVRLFWAAMRASILGRHACVYSGTPCVRDGGLCPFPFHLFQTSTTSLTDPSLALVQWHRNVKGTSRIPPATSYRSGIGRTRSLPTHGTGRCCRLSTASSTLSMRMNWLQLKQRVPFPL
jgi:hypothetical protein